jgi:hypothetical protein
MSIVVSSNEARLGIGTHTGLKSPLGHSRRLSHALTGEVLIFADFKALEALGGNPHDGAKVVAKMKEMPTDDPLFGKGAIRADGRKIHPAYLFEVKKPADSKYPWDYYNLIATIPADEAFIPLEKSACPLLKKS